MIDNLPASYDALEYADFPSVGIKLIPPAGFVRADRFHGFTEPENRASIMISTSPVSYADTTKVFLEYSAYEASKRFKENEALRVKIDGNPGTYLYVVQPMGEGVAGKHFLTFGNDKLSWMVTGFYDQPYESEFCREIVKSIMSIKMIPTDVVSQSGADVDFTLSAPTLQPTAGWSNTIAFTKDGVFPTNKKTDPFFKATPSVETVQVNGPDQEKFAISKIRPSPHIEINEIFIKRGFFVNDLPAYEMMALAYDHSIKTDILLYTAVIFEQESYILMHGWAGQMEDTDWGGEFKAIARSFKRKSN